MDIEVIKSDLKYDGNVLKVVKDEIKAYNKNMTREVVLRGNAAAVIAIDKDNKIIFVKQYRHAAKTFVLEIPAGMIDGDESPLNAAVRELEEETGYKTKNIQLVNWTYSAIGFCTEKIYLYIAKELEQSVQNFDEDEYIELERYTLDEALKMIFDGSIYDSKTVMGILAYNYMNNQKDCL